MSISNYRNRVSSNRFNKFNRNLLASSALVMGMGFAQYAHAVGMPVPTITPTANNSNIARQNYGNATISTTNNANNTQTMQINQSTNRAVIDWQSFNVGSGNNVNFTVPTHGATLNQIHDVNASVISGTVHSNGTLYLANPNGFVFSVGSDVSAKNLLVTTQTPNADAFYNSSNNIGLFSASSNSNRGGNIDLYGNIHADQGFLAIIAPQVFVASTGVVSANLGRVNLVGGEVVNIVDFSGTGLMTFELSDNLEQGRLSHPHAAMIENAGMVTGATVQMDAKAAKHMLNYVTSNSASIVEHGKITTNNLVMNVVGGNIDTTLVKNLVAGSMKLSATKGGNIWTNNLNATNGNVIINADGSIETSDINALGGSVVLKATNGNIAVSGNIVASGVASLTANKDIFVLSANAAAISMKAGSGIAIGKEPEWGQTTHYRLGENEDFPNLDGTTIRGYALNALSGDIDLVSSKGLIDIKAAVTAAKNININGRRIVVGSYWHTSSVKSLNGDINLVSQNGFIEIDGRIEALMGNVNINVNIDGTQNNSYNTIYASIIKAQSIHITTAGAFDTSNHHEEITATNGDIVINAGGKISNYSYLTASGHITLNSETGIYSEDAAIAGGDISLTSGTGGIGFYANLKAGGNVSAIAQRGISSKNVSAGGDIEFNSKNGNISTSNLISERGKINLNAGVRYYWYDYNTSRFETGTITALNGTVTLGSEELNRISTGAIRTNNITVNLPGRTIDSTEYYNNRHKGKTQFSDYVRTVNAYNDTYFEYAGDQDGIGEFRLRNIYTPPPPPPPVIYVPEPVVYTPPPPPPVVIVPEPVVYVPPPVVYVPPPPPPPVVYTPPPVTYTPPVVDVSITVTPVNKTPWWVQSSSVGITNVVNNGTTTTRSNNLVVKSSYTGISGNSRITGVENIIIYAPRHKTANVVTVGLTNANGGYQSNSISLNTGWGGASNTTYFVGTTLVSVTVVNTNSGSRHTQHANHGIDRNDGGWDNRGFGERREVGFSTNRNNGFAPRNDHQFGELRSSGAITNSTPASDQRHGLAFTGQRQPVYGERRETRFNGQPVANNNGRRDDFGARGGVNNFNPVNIVNGRSNPNVTVLGSVNKSVTPPNNMFTNRSPTTPPTIAVDYRQPKPVTPTLVTPVASTPTVSTPKPVTPTPVTPTLVTPVASTPTIVTPVASAPVTPVASAPVTPVASAPVTPVASAPVTPVASAPVTPVASAPVTPVTSAPDKPVASAPEKSVTPAPTTPVAKALPVLPGPVVTSKDFKITYNGNTDVITNYSSYVPQSVSVTGLTTMDASKVSVTTQTSFDQSSGLYKTVVTLVTPGNPNRDSLSIQKVDFSPTAAGAGATAPTVNLNVSLPSSNIPTTTASFGGK